MRRPTLRLCAMLLLSSLFLLCILHLSASAEEHPGSLSARAACLMEASRCEQIYGKNENQRLPMASTTKIVTCLVALEHAPLDEIVTIDARACGIEGSSLYLKEGERLTLLDLLYGLMLRSANDAAEAIALHLSGSIDAFCELMNEKARALGLTDTHFDNPHGLDSAEHYTTAKELALISASAMQNETFRTIVKTKRHLIAKGTESARLLVNHNRLLNLYDGAVGIKTGFTKKCGRTLVGAAERDGVTLISVTLDAPSDWSDHERLFDYGFSKIERRTPVEKGEYAYDLPIFGGEKGTIRVMNTEQFSHIVRREEERAHVEVILPRYLIAPIQKDDAVGKIRITLEDGSTHEIAIVATETVRAKPHRRFLFF